MKPILKEHESEVVRADTLSSVLLLEPLIESSLKPYRVEYADDAQKLCSYGLTECELADWFDTDTETVLHWKAENTEFRQAVDHAKCIADGNVAAALYRRAVGYDIPTMKTIKRQGQVAFVTQYTKHVPPSVSACIFWLRNRVPREWGSLSQTIVADQKDTSRY